MLLTFGQLMKFLEKRLLPSLPAATGQSGIWNSPCQLAVAGISRVGGQMHQAANRFGLIKGAVSAYGVCKVVDDL